MGKTKPRTKRRRKHGKPIELSLEELGLLTHIRSHLINGKFQHKNAATGKILGHDQSYISRIVTRLEEKGQITVEREHGARGLWLVAVLTPKQPHAPVHVAGCPCYQVLEPETDSATCTGEHNTVDSLPIAPLSVDGISLDSYKNTLYYDAPLHVAEDLAAARLKLKRLKDTSRQEFSQKNTKYYAREIRKAQDEVWRLQDLQAVDVLRGESR